MVRNRKKSKPSNKENLVLKRSFSDVIFVIICFIFLGCSGPESEIQNDFILKTSVLTIDRNYFVEELDLKLSAYPYDIKSRTLEYNQLIIGLVQSLSEESILLTAADQMGITVTEQELESAVAEFKLDYPGNSFKKVLLKNAVSYPFWRHRFKKQMIIDRVIDRELRDKIEISAEEMVAFYQTYQTALSGNAVDHLNGDAFVTRKIENEKELVSRLKMQKTQEKYGPWLKGLEKKYPVEINNDQIMTFLIKTETDEGK